MGKAVPYSDKLATLATWLDINEHWLHYGPPAAESPSARKGGKENRFEESLSEEVLILASKMEALSEHQRYLIEELVVQLERSGRKRLP